MRGYRIRAVIPILGLLLLGAVSACSPTAQQSAPQPAQAQPAPQQPQQKVMYIGGIPDQDLSVLETRFKGIADYLSKETGLKVQYVPTVDYAALVTAFKQGDVQLAWFGGLTGVQARLAAPGAQAIVQRPQDEKFVSVFIAQKSLGVKALADLRGKTLTFGSESSTSGHLMPRYYVMQAGLVPEKDLKSLNYSGSHDTTIKLVETGAFQAGALNVDVWQRNVRDGKVDTGKVDVFYTTPPYYDYHWVVRGDLDQKFGQGTADKIKQAFLKLNASNGETEKKIMDAFDAKNFIPTTNDNYKAIEDVARSLGIVQN